MRPSLPWIACHNSFSPVDKPVGGGGEGGFDSHAPRKSTCMNKMNSLNDWVVLDTELFIFL